MVGGLKTVLVKEGYEQAFESLFTLRNKMRDHEPGRVLYSPLNNGERL